MNVSFDAYNKGDLLFGKVVKPLITNELSIGCKHEGSFPQELEKVFCKGNSFLCIRRTCFSKRSPDKRNIYTMVSDTKDEQVDMDLTKLPVCSIYCEIE